MSNINTRRLKTLDLVYAALFAVIITICSWISIPAAVPFTMQTFAIFITWGLLGGKRANMAILLYLLLGFIGLPVFSGFKGGAGVLLGPTGGYLVGFIIMIWLMELIRYLLGRGRMALIMVMTAGLLLLYAFGSAWYMFGYLGEISWSSFAAVLSVAVVPFIIPDIIKMLLAIFLLPKLSAHIRE